MLLKMQKKIPSQRHLVLIQLLKGQTKTHTRNVPSFRVK
jgi:hypothetical protein